MLSIPAGDTFRIIPFRILVVGNFGAGRDASQGNLSDRQIVSITNDGFDSAMRIIAPRLELLVDNKLQDDHSQLKLQLEFNTLTDFEPAGIVMNAPALRSLVEQLNGPAADELSRHDRRDLQARLEQQVYAITCHEKFRQLEGAWRGLRYLVSQVSDSSSIVVDLAHCTQQELSNDFERASEMEDSWLFDVCQREFESDDGIPISLIVGDFRFTSSSMDIELLRRIAEVAADAQCPFLSNAAPELFGVEQWSGLNELPDLSLLFQSLHYVAWRSLCKTPASRYLTLTLPEVLARGKYIAQNNMNPLNGYDEDQLASLSGRDVPVNQLFCSMNAAYALAGHIARVCSPNGRFEYMSGPETGELIGLTTVSVPLDNHGIQKTCTPSFRLPKRHANALKQLRFASIQVDDGKAYFEAAPSLHLPEQYEGVDGERATRDAALASQLPCVLMVSRVSHAVRLQLLRLQQIGLSRAEQEQRVTAWAKTLTTPPDEETQLATSATDERLLEDLHIELLPLPGHPDYTQVTLSVRPLAVKSYAPTVRMKFVV